MQVLLFTGKGGVGKTTAAAATGALAASQGVKTLVISTDPAHSLADALGVRLGSEPIEIEPGLSAQQVDAQERFERTWREVQGYLLSALEKVGVDPLEAEELTVLPGADEVLALLAVREQIESGRYDLVIVDCAPTAETLRLLSLPDALSWYMKRIWPVERRVVRSLRPVLNRVTSVPMPTDVVFDAVERLHAELAAVRAVLADAEQTAVRLVLTPEAVVVAEARRTMTTLSLYGYRVDAVLANRIIPPGDPWRDRWAKAQEVQLAEVEESFAPLPVLRVPYQAAEPVGLEALVEVGRAAYGDLDPTGLPPQGEPMDVQRTADGFTLSIPLPFAEKDQLDLSRRGDELVVTVASWRRLLTLPSALRRCDVTGAHLVDGRLLVDFVPDPAVWMTT
ncbi:MAG: arsenite/tail-anchored protein-transporting ATPase [Frankiaceae bacterium]|jgi:arsenite-transporting ATPase|nr:arsenite/tail-anchored protein-transporting ATPase [Frankiaceae bacterium]MDQ1636415.1 arsenite/tail-anchored protein-transporting ATPase [Frankiaceae bacterium]MDQ1672870.1 arsenite/tail-anchored protein-transporting ATPase [Frankiaceae bacterium]